MYSISGTVDLHETVASNGLIHGELVGLFTDLFAGRNLHPIPSPEEFAARRAARDAQERITAASS